MPLIHGPQLGLSGRYKFHVLHADTRKPITGRDGVPIYRDASGFVKRAGVWQPNLITDRGLDEYSDHSLLRNSDMRDSLKVGTGSTPPATTDTTLDTYHGQSDATGVGDGVYTYEYDTSGNPVFRLSGVSEKVFTASGSVTLSEFGFDHDSGDHASIRELLRDGAGDPTTVALTDGQQLAVSHEAFMVVQEATPASFDVVEKNLAGATVNTESYTGTLYTVMQYHTSSYMSRVEPALVGSSSFEDLIFQSTRTEKPLGIGSGKHVDIDSANDVRRADLGTPSYTPGNHYVDIPLVLDPVDQLPGDAPVRSVGCGYTYGDDLRTGYWLTLDTGQAIPKANTHNLTLNLRLSWARA